MHVSQNYIRNVTTHPVAADEVRDLAAVLVHEPLEVLLTARGPALPPVANRPRQVLQDGRRAAAALARRNIRSLLAVSADIESVIEALTLALSASPRDAEDALEDALLEINLRYSIYADPDASVRLSGRTLVIANGAEADVRIARRSLREEGAAYFSEPALDRLVGMDIDEVCLAPQAVLPVWMQLEAGAVMSPDTAHQHLRKGVWRGIRKPDFIKEFCVACGRCFVHCPENAIIHAANDPQASQTSGILGIDTDRCTACGLCANVCVTNREGYKAITMIAVDTESSPELHCLG